MTHQERHSELERKIADSTITADERYEHYLLECDHYRDCPMTRDEFDAFEEDNLLLPIWVTQAEQAKEHCA